MTGPVGRAYAALLAAGEVKPDPDQKRAVAALDRFAADAQGDRRGLFKRLIGKAQRPRGAQPLVHVEHERVEVRSPIWLEGDVIEGEIHQHRLAAPDAAPQIDACGRVGFVAE